MGHRVQSCGPWGPIHISSFLSLTHSTPQAWWNFLGCPRPTGTQTSIIMADSSDTLSLASCVRFRLPVTSVMLPLVALTTRLDLAITQGNSGLLAGQAVPSGFTCSPEQKELWEKGGLASCPTQLCTHSLIDPHSLTLCTLSFLPSAVDVAFWRPIGAKWTSSPSPVSEKTDRKPQLKIISLMRKKA